MHGTIFAELSLIIVVAAAMAMLMRAIRQPLIIGYILTGILVGPSALHFVKSADTIEVFSTIGIALLLFIIGLGLNPKVIKEVGRVAAVVGVLQVLFITAFSYGGGKILGFNKKESLVFGVALAFSSTIIILKLLSDLKEQNRLFGKVATGLLIVQDVLAMIALLFVTSQDAGGFSVHLLGQLALKGFVIALPLLLIGNAVLPRLGRLIAGSPEVLFLFALGWGFGSAALFERSGFSLEIGALIAGVSLASLPYTAEISARLRPLRDFFIVVFFISLGTRLNFTNFSHLVPAIIMGSLLVVIVKPLVVLILMGLLGYTKRNSFKTAVTMGQVSEFSLVLVILANRQHLVSDQLVSLITIIALISITVSTYFIIYADKIFSLLERQLAMFERRKSTNLREHRYKNDLILFGYHRGGHEFVKVFKTLNKRFVVIDYDPETIDVLEHHKFPYLYGDATDLELLKEAGVEHAKLVVSTISNHNTNRSLVKFIIEHNAGCVVIVHAETVEEAEELYTIGATYVVMPHYIGSERIGSFIRKNGLNKEEFEKYRQKHLAYLQSHYSPEIE